MTVGVRVHQHRRLDASTPAPHFDPRPPCSSRSPLHPDPDARPSAVTRRDQSLSHPAGQTTDTGVSTHTQDVGRRSNDSPGAVPPASTPPLPRSPVPCSSRSPAPIQAPRPAAHYRVTNRRVLQTSPPPRGWRPLESQSKRVTTDERRAGTSPRQRSTMSRRLSRPVTRCRRGRQSDQTRRVSDP